MKLDLLVPLPHTSEPFRRNRERFIPAKPGCYALTTFEREVLYIGLTINLRRRINEHLDSAAKTELTARGRAVLVHWTETTEINKIERTWLNIHLLNEGCLPILNSVYSPTST
ncbi:MAG: GIY-YIG nuclease family protein [Candidatus Competibacteraceae bacterium]